MKTLPLRELLRRPTLVKQLTAQGDSVRVTDNGKALWVVMPDVGEVPVDEEDEAVRSEWIEGYFDDLMLVPVTVGPALSDLVLESRGVADEVLCGQQCGFEPHCARQSHGSLQGGLHEAGAATFDVHASA